MKASTWLHWLSVGMLTVSLMGCKSLLKKRVPVAAPSDSAPVAAAPPAPPPPPPPAVVTPATGDSAQATAVADDDSVPSPEDFEDEAFEKVTAANFKAEFARLQKEVAK
jgi:hypothetical protein